MQRQNTPIVRIDSLDISRRSSASCVGCGKIGHLDVLWRRRAIPLMRQPPADCHCFEHARRSQPDPVLVGLNARRNLLWIAIDTMSCLCASCPESVVAFGSSAGPPGVRPTAQHAALVWCVINSFNYFRVFRRHAALFVVAIAQL